MKTIFALLFLCSICAKAEPPTTNLVWFGPHDWSWLEFPSAPITQRVTNVVETVTAWERYEPAPCPEGRIGCLVYHWNGVNPTAKTVTTTVWDVSTLAVKWGSETHKLEHKELVSTDTQHLRLSVKWEPYTPTNTWGAVTLTNVGFMTNASLLWQSRINDGN